MSTPRTNTKLSTPKSWEEKSLEMKVEKERDNIHHTIIANGKKYQLMTHMTETELNAFVQTYNEFGGIVTQSRWQLHSGEYKPLIGKGQGGSESNVRIAAKENETGNLQYYAIKKIRPDENDKKDLLLSQARNEYFFHQDFLSKIPNAENLYAIIDAAAESTSTASSNPGLTTVYHIMEMANFGDANGLIAKINGDMFQQSKLTKNERNVAQNSLTEDILNIVATLHQNNLYHRDIKPANFLAYSDGKLKLGDFGAGAAVNKTNENPIIVISPLSDKTFHSPEMLGPSFNLNPLINPEEAKNHFELVDSWATGITLALLYGADMSDYFNMMKSSIPNEDKKEKQKVMIEAILRDLKEPEYGIKLCRRLLQDRQTVSNAYEQFQKERPAIPADAPTIADVFAKMSRTHVASQREEVLIIGDNDLYDGKDKVRIHKETNQLVSSTYENTQKTQPRSERVIYENEPFKRDRSNAFSKIRGKVEEAKATLKKDPALARPRSTRAVEKPKNRQNDNSTDLRSSVKPKP